MRKLWISILFILCSQVANAATYNIGPGQTYETFTALVAAETLAGDDIVDGGGNTFNESWIPDASGTSGHQITLRNATIDGFATVTDWTNDGDGTYSKTGIAACLFFSEDDVLLVNASSSALSDGNWYLDGTTLHYKPTSGVSSDHTTKRESITYGINLADRSYITVSNITVTGCRYGVGAYQSSAASDGLIISGCSFTKNIGGIILSGTSGTTFSSNQITNNTFTNCNYGFKADARPSSGDISTGIHAGYTVSGNTFTNVGYGNGGSDNWDGLIAGSVDREGIGVQNWQNSSISGNVISGNIRGIYIYTREQGTSTNNAVYQNDLNNLTGNAIMVRGNMSATEISGNMIYSNIISNITGDFGIWFSSNTSPTTTYNTIYGNTIYNAKTGLYSMSIDSAEYWKIKNNIIDTVTTRYIHIGTAPSNFECDYNLYDSADGSMWVWNNGAVTLANWKSGSGSDANSVTADPLFYNPTLHDFRVHSTSPCIDKGTDLGATYQRDYYGHWQDDNGAAWDIGSIYFNHLPTIQ